ncbi:MAG: HAMP domain-containing histidine kinase [Labilithrix sp.]|nr:HAMP domain-containing histidine kinase [Labilithrix sp.]
MEDRTSLLEHARLEIAQIRIEQFADLKRAMDAAVRVSATTLDVTRVGIWSLAADRATLRCVVLHDQRSKEISGEDISLPLSAWPAYLEAVLSRRVVVAEDALADPRTRELGHAYLVPRGVTSMMDAPLFVGGEIWGIVCHEHTGPARAWSPREVDFAVSVADMVSSMLEQAMRLAMEERLRTAEAELARVRQAEAVVRTASAIGHDVNTLLQAISGSAERALDESEASERRSALGAVVADCQRAARVVDQLRELERPGPTVGIETDLSFVVDDARPTLEALLGAGHALVTELALEALVPARRADVERILLNLVVNAKEAMTDGGTVTVVVRASPSGVSLDVRDRGPGITPEQAARVFDPYFTTKSGRNTGLGLFAVKTVARASGAHVTFTSEPGEGTSVAVTWPRVLDK